MAMINRVYRQGEILWRLVHVADGTAWLYRLGSRRIDFRTMQLTELEGSIANGTVAESKDPYQEGADAKPVKRSLEERALRDYGIIRDLVTSPETLYSKNARAKAIKESSRKFGVDRQKICRLLRLWWEKGQTQSALISGYGKNTGQRSPRKKVGRPSLASSSPPIDDAIRKEFETAYRRYLLKEEPCSVPQAYRHFRVDFARSHPEIEELRFPSFGQFQYHYRRYHSSDEIVRKQTRPSVYDKDIRPLGGSVYDIVDAPGVRYEIDSTNADVELVSATDRTKLIGRPTLYCVTDTFSGLIVGVHASIDSAQYKGAADALYDAITDKVEQCANLGIKIKSGDWPAFGLPTKVVADNAELLGDRIETFAAQYQIQIDNTVPYRADQKGTVERALGLVQSILKSQTPGVPEKPASKKSGYRERRTEAVLTLNDYRKMVVTAALQANNRFREKTPPDFGAEEKPTPLGIWKWAEKRGNLHLADPGDLRKLRLSLLPSGRCSVSRKGLLVNGIRYWSDDASRTGLFDRIKGAKRATGGLIAYDPADITHAWYYPEPTAKPNRCYRCRLAPESRYLKGMTFTEAVDAIALRRKTKAVAKEEDKQQAAIWTAVRQDVLDNVAAKAPQSTESDDARLRELAENRRKERSAMEKTEKRMAGGNAPVQNTNGNATKETAGSGEGKVKLGPMGFPQLAKDIPD